VTVGELIAQLQGLNPNLEVWSTHPDMGIQWGPIAGVCEAITDQFQVVAQIDTRVPEDGDDAGTPG
jgi:hypothetical protein